MEAQNLNGINVEVLLDHLTREARQQYEAKTAELDKLLARLETVLAKYEHHDTETIFDVSSVAKYLKISVPTVYTKVNKRDIPHYKKNNKLWFKKSEVDQWMTSGKKRYSNAEIEKQAENYINKH